MEARRAIFLFGFFASLGCAIAGRASPPCEPLALRLTVTTVAIDGAAAMPPTTPFFIRDLGGGSFGGFLFDPDRQTRELSMGMR